MAPAYLLAIETSQSVGSIAVVENGSIIGRQNLPEKKPAEQLIPAIDALLHSLHLTLADIGGFAVSLGPGSFTSLRIGLATVKGLHMVTQRPVVGVANVSTIVDLASLAWKRFAQGSFDDPAGLVPIYTKNAFCNSSKYKVFI